MTALLQMTKSNYTPPKLEKSPERWSTNFHSFIKSILVKNPKKRPAAKTILDHPFTNASGLSHQLAIDLINKGKVTPPIVHSDEDEDFPEQTSQNNSFLLTPPQIVKSGSLLDEINQNLTLNRGFTDVAPTVIPSNRAPKSPEKTDTVSPRAPQRPEQTPSRPSNSKTLHSLDQTELVSGLPPTQKVHMGACFNKIFKDCPLEINCAGSWQRSSPDHHAKGDSLENSSVRYEPLVNETQKSSYLIFGSDKGIFSLHPDQYFNNFTDVAMNQIHHRRCLWMDIHEDTMMTISGNNNPWLYMHNIHALHERASYIPPAALNGDIQMINNTYKKLKDKATKKINEKYLPKTLNNSRRVPNTKGCKSCAVRSNQYDESRRYLIAALPGHILVMEWYPPMHKFMQIKKVEFDTPRISSAGIQLVIESNKPIPLVVLGVWKDSVASDRNGIHSQ